jgi:hypothetical protein
VPHLFVHRGFVAGVLLLGAFYAVVSGFFLILTLLLQIGLGYSVLKAGLTGIPFSIGVSVAAGLSGPVLVPRFGRSIITLGPLLLAFGLALFIWAARTFGGAVTPFELIPSLIVAGVGMGCVVASVYPFILADVELKNAGSASGVINTVGQIGGAMGVAVIGVIFFGLIGSQATISANAVKADLTASLAKAGIPDFIQPTVISSFETCFNDRSNAKDFTAEPESCRQGRESAAAFATTAPAMAAAVSEAVTKAAHDANEQNFLTAMERTLVWQIIALAFVFFLTFVLPRWPRRQDDLAAAGVEVG